MIDTKDIASEAYETGCKETLQKVKKAITKYLVCESDFDVKSQKLVHSNDCAKCKFIKELNLE